MANSFDILVVDDSADDVFLLREAFKKTKSASRLSFVSDGTEARAYLQGEGAYSDRSAHPFPFPQMLLLDLNMPRMNGFELLEWMRNDAQCRRLIVHVLTASTRTADVERAYDLGANSYTVKPNRFDELAAFVAALHQWHHFTTLAPQPKGNSVLAYLD